MPQAAPKAGAFFFFLRCALGPPERRGAPLARVLRWHARVRVVTRAELRKGPDRRGGGAADPDEQARGFATRPLSPPSLHTQPTAVGAPSKRDDRWRASFSVATPVARCSEAAPLWCMVGSPVEPQLASVPPLLLPCCIGPSAGPHPLRMTCVPRGEDDRRGPSYIAPGRNLQLA